jgi:hypothetical protein
MAAFVTGTGIATKLKFDLSACEVTDASEASTVCCIGATFSANVATGARPFASVATVAKTLLMCALCGIVSNMAIAVRIFRTCVCAATPHANPYARACLVGSSLG